MTRAGAATAAAASSPRAVQAEAAARAAAASSPLAVQAEAEEAAGLEALNCMAVADWAATSLEAAGWLTVE